MQEGGGPDETAARLTGGCRPFSASVAVKRPRATQVMRAAIAMPTPSITTASMAAAPIPASPQPKPLDGTSTIRTRAGAGPPVGWPKRLSGERRSVAGSTGLTASGAR